MKSTQEQRLARKIRRKALKTWISRPELLASAGLASRKI
jgi:hypothetical protein